MSRSNLRVVSVVVIVLILFPALIVGLSTPASAFWDWGWFFGGGSDTWLPPEQASGMGFSDQEYVALWGGVSIYAEDSSQFDAYESEFQSRFGESDALEQFYAMTLGLTSPEVPSDRYVRWNDRAHRLSHSGGDPTHGNVEDSFLISNAFIEIVRTDPHAYYDPGSSSWWGSSSGEEIKYIGKDAKLSFVSDESISSRPTERRGRGFGSTRTRYRITDLDRQVEITAKNSTGDIVDKSSTRSSARSISLDLSSMESGDEVHFEVVKNISAVEEETHAERVCLEWETRYRYNPMIDQRVPYEVCIDRTWEEFASYTNHDSVIVEDTTSGVIYDPTVTISSSSATQGDGFARSEFFYADVESDQPIAGFGLPDGGIVSFPYSHVTTRDREYDAALGDLTPVRHQVASFRSAPSIRSTPSVDIYSFDGESRYYNTPSGYELGESESRVTNVDSVRIGGEILGYDSSDMDMYSIIPGVEVNTEIEENPNVEITATELTTRYVQDSDDQYTVHVQLRESETGEPITTAGNSGLSVSVDHSASSGTISMNTDSNGEASHTFSASEGDTFRTTFTHSPESRAESDHVYLDSQDLLEIRLPIDGTSTLMNILTESVWVILFVFGPGILLLSAVYYAFTGKFHPF